MLQWLYLKLNALRCIALEENNINGLQSALDIAGEFLANEYCVAEFNAALCPSSSERWNEL